MNFHQNKHQLSLSRKILFTGLIVFVLSVFPVKPPQAEAFWGEFVQENYHFILKKIEDTITGTILSMLKQQAMKMVNEQLNKLIGGSSTEGAKFITNWEDYLVKQPEKNADTYINDYISKTLAGRGGSGYVPNDITGRFITQGKIPAGAYAQEGFFVPVAYAQSMPTGSGSVGNYLGQLGELAKKLTSEKAELKVTFEGDPSQMFAKGDFKGLETYLSGINNPWSYSIHIESEYEKKKAEEKKVAETKAQSYQGMKGSGEGKDGKGDIKMPGILIKEAMANAQDIGNKIIAAATHPEEIISAVVTQMISQAVEKGIGEVEQMIDKEVNGLTDKLNQNMNEKLQTFGPGAQYKNPTTNGSCTGKTNGTTCALTTPINGSSAGTCNNGTCAPKK